jgi:hypothetical protein
MGKLNRFGRKQSRYGQECRKCFFSWNYDQLIFIPRFEKSNNIQKTSPFLGNSIIKCHQIKATFGARPKLDETVGRFWATVSLIEFFFILVFI